MMITNVKRKHKTANQKLLKINTNNQTDGGYFQSSSVNAGIKTSMQQTFTKIANFSDRLYIFYGKLHNPGTNSIQTVKSFATSHKHETIRVRRKCSGVRGLCRVSTCLICQSVGLAMWKSHQPAYYRLSRK